MCQKMNIQGPAKDLFGSPSANLAAQGTNVRDRFVKLNRERYQEL